MENAKKLDGYNGIFAKRFRHLMKKTKTTQAKLAKELEVSRQAISTYMDGSVLPNLQNFQKICSFFNVPSDFLLGFSISTSFDISERKISDSIGLNSISVKNLKEFTNSDNDIESNIIAIVNTMLYCSKPMKQLSDTFLKRFDVYNKLNNTKKRLRELETELKGESLGNCEEALILLDKIDKYKKEVRWFTFLSSEYFDVMFDVYCNDLMDELYEKEREQNVEKD